MTGRRPTWAQLVRADPRFLWLEADAWRLWAEGGDQYDAFFEHLKPQIAELVGWDRKPHPVLGTEEAYDVAYDHLLAIVTRHRPKRRRRPSRHGR